MTILVVLCSYELPENPNWEDSVYATTGGGALPYLIGYAIHEVVRANNEAIRSKRNLKYLENFQLPSICADARKGDGLARATVAWHFRNGWAPASTDPIEAYKWFTLATAAGNTEASHYRTELSAKMSAEDIEEAERRATAWSADTESCVFSTETTVAQPAE